MTVIAAVIDHDAGKVCMAADSSTDYGNFRLSTSKISASGRAALGAVALTRAAPKTVPGSPDEADTWAQGVAEAITDAGVGANLKDSEGDLDGVVLLAWSDRLWLLSHHLADPIDEYVAIGSGAAHAIGAMWALPDEAAKRRAKQGVRAAIAGHAGIHGPITTAST